MLKLHELSSQKQVLLTMLNKAEKDLAKTRDYLRKLLPKH